MHTILVEGSYAKSQPEVVEATLRLFIFSVPELNQFLQWNTLEYYNNRNRYKQSRMNISKSTAHTNDKYSRIKNEIELPVQPS